MAGRPRHTSARLRNQSSSLQPGHSALQVLTQPSVRLIEPSPRVFRSASQPAHTDNGNGGPIPINFSASDMANENEMCPLCTIQVHDDGPGLFCEKCCSWFHTQCLFITDDEYRNLQGSNDAWFCDHCKSVLANRIKWANYEGESAISHAIRAAYSEIVCWRKNLFLLPRGKAAADFIKELSRLINLFVHKTKWERLALPLTFIFMPIMLQKPSKKSKARDHVKYLASRLEKWSRSRCIDG